MSVPKTRGNERNERTKEFSEAGGDSLGSGKEFSEVWGRLP
jgi:hypothetical protein